MMHIRVAVGTDGRTAYERQNGKKFRMKLSVWLEGGATLEAKSISAQLFCRLRSYQAGGKAGSKGAQMSFAGLGVTRLRARLGARPFSARYQDGGNAGGKAS